MTEPTRPCGTCGMPCTPGEYHPYAACLMFKACHNSETVRANLEAVRGTPPAVAGEPVAWRYVPSKVWSEFVYTEDPKRAQHARDNGIYVQPVFTAPQPTQAQAVAVPLTDEQIEALPMWKRFVGLWPETRREIVRTIERHHGIKGGQHGAE